MAGSSLQTFPTPTILPLGDSGLLVRFDTVLGDAGNRAAIALSRALEADPIPGVLEVVPNLVSVLLRYDPLAGNASTIGGELRLRLFGLRPVAGGGHRWRVQVRFDGPDLGEVAAALGMTEAAFVAAHNAAPLRVLATGFAPGFAYCGMHPEGMVLPRRPSVRPMVPVGSVLFAAGQTAITATDMPTGWHVIGSTAFRNFHPDATPPTQMRAGDRIEFEAGA